VALTLSQSPVTIAQTNTAAHSYVGVARDPISACQSNEVLPRATTAIRLRADSFTGPRVLIKVLAGGRVITQGERGSGWTANVVTVPVRPLPRTRSGVELCFTLFLNGHELSIFSGEPTNGPLAARGSGGLLDGRVRVEYLRPGRSSWWSLVLAVARRMGIGHAWPGTWSVLLVLTLMGLVALVCSRVILRELR